MREQTLYDNLTVIVVSIIQRGPHVNRDCFPQRMQTNLHP